MSMKRVLCGMFVGTTMMACGRALPPKPAPPNDLRPVPSPQAIAGMKDHALPLDRVQHLLQTRPEPVAKFPDEPNVVQWYRLGKSDVASDLAREWVPVTAKTLSALLENPGKLTEGELVAALETVSNECPAPCIVDASIRRVVERDWVAVARWFAAHPHTRDAWNEVDRETGKLPANSARSEGMLAVVLANGGRRRSEEDLRAYAEALATKRAQEEEDAREERRYQAEQRRIREAREADAEAERQRAYAAQPYEETASSRAGRATWEALNKASDTLKADVQQHNQQRLEQARREMESRSVPAVSRVSSDNERARREDNERARREAERARAERAAAEAAARARRDEERVKAERDRAAGEEQKRAAYLAAMRQGIRLHAANCPDKKSNYYVLGSKPSAPGGFCIDVSFRASCPGDNSPRTGVIKNYIGGSSCFAGDSKLIEPTPACAIDQVSVAVTDVQPCGR